MFFKGTFINTDSALTHHNKNKLYIHRENELMRDIQILSNGWVYLGGGRCRGLSHVSISEHSIAFFPLDFDDYLSIINVVYNTIYNISYHIDIYSTMYM